MRTSVALVALGCCAWLVAACGDSGDSPTARAPLPAPDVRLSANERRIWAKLPPDRSAIPVLLYHGVGSQADFPDPEDAAFGINADDFAKQMTMIERAGYRTVELSDFIRFVRGRKVDLPPRPLLLTFDDGLANSWTGSEGVLEELGFNAVMFVDVGRVEAGDPGYLTWPELGAMHESGLWDLQLHSGKGHKFIQHGPGTEDVGAFYAYRKPDETFGEWRRRVRSDIEWGQGTLAREVPAYRPLAFAPPYGNYGQDGTNDERIPGDLLGWLSDRYDVVFTQDVNARARPGAGPPLGRIQVSRDTSGGDVYHSLLSGKHEKYRNENAL